MQHRNLLIALLALLAVSAGGVFFLVNQDRYVAVERETFLAGVALVEEEEVFGEEPAPARNALQSDAGGESLSEADVVQDGEEQVVVPIERAAPVVLALPSEQEEQKVEEPPLEEPVEVEDVPEENVPEQEPQEQEEDVRESAQQEPVNINTADLDELQLITGVGAVIGQRLIDYRNTYGVFYSIEELKNVQGIGDVNFEKMRDQITVGDVSTPPPPPPPPPEPEPAPEPEPDPEEPPSKININTADYEELQDITGVGSVIAQRIIDYRNENGLFQNIEELKNVKGIGDVSFEKMRDEITI